MNEWLDEGVGFRSPRIFQNRGACTMRGEVGPQQPGVAGSTRLHRARPAPRPLAPAPGPTTAEKEGTADGWPSGRAEGCLCRRPPVPHRPMLCFLFLSAQRGQRARARGWVEGSLSPPRFLGLIWGPWSVLGLPLAPGSSMGRVAHGSEGV